MARESVEAAREELAETLFKKMEHLDPRPSVDPERLFDWGALSDYEKEFYRLCVKELLRDAHLVRDALD